MSSTEPFGDPADPGQGADRLRHNLAIGGAVTVAVTTRAVRSSAQS